MNLNLTWKSFDLGVFMQGVGNRTLIRTDDYSMPWSDWWRQPPLFYYGNTWNEDRPQCSVSAPQSRQHQILELSAVDSDRHQRRVPEIEEPADRVFPPGKHSPGGGTVPPRIYFSGFDLWETDQVPGGWDPEASANGFNYPFQRLYSVGADITF